MKHELVAKIEMSEAKSKKKNIILFTFLSTLFSSKIQYFAVLEIVEDKLKL